MKNFVHLLTGTALLGSLFSGFAADVTGKITLKGKPLEEKVIDALKNDPTCGKLRTDVPRTRLYVTGANGELADTFVYIKEGLPAGKNYEPSAQPVVLDQTGCEYMPYVFGIQTKQKLLIKNSDPVMHNINATMSKAGNKPFNEAQMKGQDKTKTFDNPELFLPFQCNVHPWMYAYGCVVDHPYFAVSKKDGTFTLANVPPGKYVIEAFHRKAGKVTREVTVGSDSQTVDFTLELK